MKGLIFFAALLAVALLCVPVQAGGGFGAGGCNVGVANGFNHSFSVQGNFAAPAQAFGVQTFAVPVQTFAVPVQTFGNVNVNVRHRANFGGRFNSRFGSRFGGGLFGRGGSTTVIRHRARF